MALSTSRSLSLLVAGTLTPVLLGVAAAPAHAGTSSAEVEGFGVTPGAGTSVSDPNASGGKDMLLWSNGAATGSVSFAGSASSLMVRALGDQCQGAPVLQVSVDGVVAGSRTVSATSWTGYTLNGNWKAGTHTVALRYTNDMVAGGCDRNLRLDRLVFTTGTVTPPPPSGRSVGLSEGDGANRGLGGALATASATGQHLDEFNFYMAWAYNEAFPTSDMQAIVAAGALPSITWEPWQPGAGAYQSTYSLDNIINGRFDSYIDSWARAAAAFGSPMKLRFAHEMNGSWYPWGATVNGNSPAKYVAAYRHVHDRFAAAGASNVRWVWSMNIVDGMPTPLNQLYPGDAYVDSVGVDGYNGGTDNPGMGGWHTPSQVFSNTLVQVAQIAGSKPVYLAETGSAVGGGDKAGWVRDLFTYLKSTPVTGVDWFEFGGYPDWRLTSSSGVLDAARTALSTW